MRGTSIVLTLLALQQFARDVFGPFQCAHLSAALVYIHLQCAVRQIIDEG